MVSAIGALLQVLFLEVGAFVRRQLGLGLLCRRDRDRPSPLFCRDCAAEGKEVCESVEN